MRGATEMHRRGIRVVPGGDYGLFCNPQGRNARDLEHFVTLLGFSPMEAIVAGTRHGGELMGDPDGIGQIRPGYLADLLLVDGDPLADIDVLRKVAFVMKDGKVFKQNGVATPTKFYK